ncbi:hypothetical protein [Aromatoleum anaerobium]|uniref:Uncharacterized protein n=1 Tax=Aromatoleum anaerobium TaxID=182180 RepID=A0ABX1PQ90_9RHOO|nr:hypothetical protein [Aromatoleum anaerobium]MCK0508464.1 hypothetical protein [Aromatoleum anaerobium]
MTTISNKVRYYRSDMAGAPVLSGTAGALISVLDACLVDGWDVRVINSLTVADGIATAQISAGHFYGEGDVIRVAGATPAALNGAWRLASVTGSTAVWSVAGLGIAAGSATGTITAMRAPAGWEKVFAATNTAVYRGLDVAGLRHFVRVDDTGTTTARLRGFEEMSDADTGTGPYPTDTQLSGGLWVGKSYAASGTARPWRLVADGRRFAIFSAPYYSNLFNHATFGDLLGAAAGDAYASLCSGPYSSGEAITMYTGQTPRSGNLPHSRTGNSTNGVFLARNGAGVAGAVLAKPIFAGSYVTGAASYATPISGDALPSEPVQILENDSTAGIPRGVAPQVRHLPFSAGSYEGLRGVPGDGLRIVAAHNCFYAIDLGANGKWD